MKDCAEAIPAAAKINPNARIEAHVERRMLTNLNGAFFM
jgi:hypothetical protein